MVDVKWYGINALEIRHSNGSFMIDPYVSRNRETVHVPEEFEKYLGTAKPDFVLMTHAHYDHLPDMPALIRHSCTVLYASKTACNIMRAFGVPEKNLHELYGGEVLNLPGGVKVTVYETLHMGDIPATDRYAAPPDPDTLVSRMGWLCGEIFAFMIEVDGMSILNMGSANLLERTMKGLECDVLLSGISRWQKGFPELLMSNLRFKCLIPTHHDDFYLPLDQFRLRNDLDRLLEVIPNLPYRELKILDWITL